MGIGLQGEVPFLATRDQILDALNDVPGYQNGIEEHRALDRSRVRTALSRYTIGSGSDRTGELS